MQAEKQSADLQVSNDKENILERHLSKPGKGQQARLYIAGTKGAEICDELLDVVNEASDLIVTKHHGSAFDQTSLLTALRQKLVTKIYLCGYLTNVGVYSTAADAVQHGLQVTVVEDCLGYRSEEKHEEAMRQMADIMGVNRIDSEEIIKGSGGRPVPDPEVSSIMLESRILNIAPTIAIGIPPPPQAVDDICPPRRERGLTRYFGPTSRLPATEVLEPLRTRNFGTKYIRPGDSRKSMDMGA